jgi:hypothetical protein
LHVTAHERANENVAAKLARAPFWDGPETVGAQGGGMSYPFHIKVLADQYTGVRLISRAGFDGLSKVCAALPLGSGRAQRSRRRSRCYQLQYCRNPIMEEP